MVLNAADFLKKRTEKEIHKAENNSLLPVFEVFFRWKGVVDRIRFVKYKQLI